MANKITPFSSIYNSFLSKITDDMYMELTELETFLGNSCNSKNKNLFVNLVDLDYKIG